VSDCLRCPGSALRPTGSAGTLQFLECPRCSRRYSRDGDRALTERWPGSLGLALYGVIVTERPQEPEHVGRNADGLGHLDAGSLIGEIRLELASPSQPVREILPGMRASEVDLRTYLGLLADELDRRRRANHG
jgi:hypothetical protein